MNKRYLGGLFVAMLLVTLSRVSAQDILSFENGYLTFTNANPGLFYRVEFRPNLSDTEEWSEDYYRLMNIQTNASTVTVPVGTFFRVVGSPDPVGIGTAQPSDIRAPQTVFINGQEVTGTMPDIGGAHITPGTVSQSIPAGYHDGSGMVTGDAALTAGNIREGAEIFGVEGSFVQAAVPKTGQTSGFRSRDDGNLQRGVSPPSPRFIDHGDGTVTDLRTNLMWVKAPHGLAGNSTAVFWTWQNGMDFCNGVANSNFAGYNDWRMPNVLELQSLIDYGSIASPALPSGHPFEVFTGILYWTSTTFAHNTSAAWRVELSSGELTVDFKSAQTARVWPVRGGY